MLKLSYGDVTGHLKQTFLELFHKDSFISSISSIHSTQVVTKSLIISSLNAEEIILRFILNKVI